MATARLRRLGTGPKKFTEKFAYLMPFQRHVTLGFYHGGELPDPGGLLPEAGGRQVGGLSHYAQPPDHLA
jgi:hypothetical protein